MRKSRIVVPPRIAPSRRYRVWSTGIARTRAQPPRMKPRLKMLEPTMLPTEMSPWPFNAAMIVTANSGAEVPSATTVRPMTSSEMPSRLDSREADSTTQCAPAPMMAMLPTTITEFNQSGSWPKSTLTCTPSGRDCAGIRSATFGSLHHLS